MDNQTVWDSVSQMYAGAYDSAVAQLDQYIGVRDGVKNIEPGSKEELRAVVLLTLEMVASELELGSEERFLAIEDGDGWKKPIVRYIVEYKEDICDYPDEQLDSIQGWLGDLSSSGMIPKAAKADAPEYSILQTIIDSI